MFIHFGLYSELGGVWEGKPVTRGYSEQIQSFAGIFSDWYGDTALRFNPTAFNADSIVALAKEAGMKSIVITTKHHDGFCMFHTATTDFNSYDATPATRDLSRNWLMPASGEEFAWDYITPSLTGIILTAIRFPATTVISLHRSIMNSPNNR